MADLAFDQLFAALTTQQPSFDEAAQRQQWLAGLDQGAHCQPGHAYSTARGSGPTLLIRRK